MTTDPATQRMCEETGHSCDMCPSEVRNLAAVAHNLSWRVRATAKGEPGHWPKIRLMLDDLDHALETLQPTTDAHFEAFKAWRRP